MDSTTTLLANTTSKEEELSYNFIWNGQTCRGTALHESVVKNDVAAAGRLLRADPHLLHVRFRYETHFQGTSHEGSGEPIHLAVSRGEVAMVQLLLEQKASLDATVTDVLHTVTERRSTLCSQGHYDVFHAAVFAEGKGGDAEVVRFLLDKKAELSKNIDGHYPLHKAFQTGKLDIIQMLRDEGDARGLPDLEDVEPGHKVPTPLEWGIHFAKLTEDQLASVAPLTPMALHLFSRYEPRCIVKWLERCSQAGIRADYLAKYVTVEELAMVLREATPAAEVLLRSLSTEAEVTSQGWHPLPSRMSFAPRTWIDKIQQSFNPPLEVLAFYQDESDWSFDLASFKKPEWHNTLTDRSPGEPIYDVDIKVCHVPGLVCPEFFLGVESAGDEDELVLFTNSTVRGLISYVYWEGACRVDMVRLFLSIWGLALLVHDQAYAQGREHDDAAPRELRGHGHGHQHHDHPSFAPQDRPHVGQLDPAALRLSINFVGARGVLDLANLLIVIMGYVRLGWGRDVVSMDKAFQVLIAAAPVLVFLWPASCELRVVVIFIYWMSLLSINHLSENIGRLMLPMLDLVMRLVPSLMLTILGFCGFTHAYFVFELKHFSEVELEEHLLLSFSRLFTGALPASTEGMGPGELVLAYISVTVFMLFFLNIFIGVISEQYTIASQRVNLRFQQVLSVHCTRFLILCDYLPTAIIPKVASIFVGAAAMVVLLALQVLEDTGHPVPCGFAVNFLCIGVAHLSAYQHPGAPWLRKVREKQDFYLWTATVKVEKEERPEIVNLRQSLEAARRECDLARSELTKLGLGDKAS